MDRSNVVHATCCSCAPWPAVLAQWVVLDVVVPELDPVCAIAPFVSCSTLPLPISHQREMVLARALFAAAGLGSRRTWPAGVIV